MTVIKLVISIFTLSWLMSYGVVAIASGSDQHGPSVSSHGPIGVMGEHMHKQGEFMFSYRVMRMDMNGNRVGTQRLSARDIVGSMSSPGQFMVAPTRMPMTMHMLGLMYGATDRITLMLMANYSDNSMDHLIRNGREFSTESSGVGDTKVSALIRLLESSRANLHFGLGVSLPTGSTSERADTPAMLNAVLPYPMQLGSGTYDITPSFTYTSSSNALSWGAQVSAIIRTGENDDGYTLGNQTKLTSWLAHELSDRMSISLRATFQDLGGIDGINDALNPQMVQTANTQLQSGDRTDISFGLNYLFRNGHRLALEYAKPVRQDLAGPQLEVDSLVTFGWQKAF